MHRIIAKALTHGPKLGCTVNVKLLLPTVLLSILGLCPQVLLCSQGTQPVRFHEQEIQIPWAQASPQGLDALLVYAERPGTHPLVVMTHGTSREREARDEVTAWAQLPQAIWFARRGWVVLAVVRRGYGKSGGKPDYRFGHCPQTDYLGAAEDSAEDLRRALSFGSKLPQVDPSRMIAVGHSTGGLATVALTAEAPNGLLAAINFAGGRGSRADHDVCNADELVGAYRKLGRHSRTPMLWIYAENDKYFWPELARRFDQAFRSSGGQDQFVLAPAFREDGHGLFRQGPSVWGPIVDGFLRAHNLALLDEPLPSPAIPNVAVPAGLSENGQNAFRTYLTLGPHKAFAVSGSHFGYSTAQMDVDEARVKALENCRKTQASSGPCVIVSVDDEARR